MMQMSGGGGAQQPGVGSGAVMCEFKYPIRKEQLCDEPADSNRFWVKARRNLSKAQEDEVLRIIETVSEGISSSLKCLSILDNDNFDLLYSILYYLEEMSASVRKELIELLNKGLRFLLKGMERERILSNDTAFEHRRSL